MQGLNLCFTNFKTKEHLAHLVTLCHYMGACVRRDMSSKIDFLVTNVLHGPKYRVSFNWYKYKLSDNLCHTAQISGLGFDVTSTSL